MILDCNFDVLDFKSKFEDMGDSTSSTSVPTVEPLLSV